MKLKWVVAVAVWLLALANIYFMRIADPDVWWYLRCGEDILQSGQIKQVDTYSFTANGLPYVNHEWLTQILFAFVFKHAGGAGLVWLKVAVGAALLVVLYRLARLHSDDPRIYWPAFLLGAHLVGRYLLFRPQTFTFLFFTTALFILEQERRQPTRRLWLLPPMLCLWANMHAAFAVGIALIGYYWLVIPWFEPNKPFRISGRLRWVLVGSALATFANPYGLSLWQYVLQESSNVQNKMYVQEWRPTRFVPFGWNSAMFLLTLTLTAISGLAARTRDWAEVLLGLIFAALGFSAPRHIPLFAIIAAHLWANWSSAFARRHSEWRGLNLALASALGVILLPSLLIAGFAITNPRPRISILDQHYGGFPYQAVEFLRRQPIGGNVFNEMPWGGYLMWKLAPRWKISLDGRNITVYPSQVVRDHFELLYEDQPDLTVLQRYAMDVCLLHRNGKVARSLAAAEQWQEVYADEIAVIYRHRTSAWTDAVSSSHLGAAAPRPSELFLERD